MALQPDRQTLKLQAINALDQARASLRGGLAEAREHWRPRNLIRERVEKHHIAIAVASVVAGFVAFRWLFSGSSAGASAGASHAPRRRRTLTGFLMSGLWGMAREPLIALASQQLLPIVMQYMSQFQAPKRTSNPE